MIRHLSMPAFALAVTVGIAAAGSGDADYELIVPGINPVICAKSKADCEAAAEAIYAGRWSLPVDVRDNQLICHPHPGCFSASSNVIRGYNDK